MVIILLFPIVVYWQSGQVLRGILRSILTLAVVLEPFTGIAVFRVGSYTALAVYSIPVA